MNKKPCDWVTWAESVSDTSTRRRTGTRTHPPTPPTHWLPSNLFYFIDGDNDIPFSLLPHHFWPCRNGFNVPWPSHKDCSTKGAMQTNGSEGGSGWWWRPSPFDSKKLRNRMAFSARRQRSVPIIAFWKKIESRDRRLVAGRAPLAVAITIYVLVWNLKKVLLRHERI